MSGCGSDQDCAGGHCLAGSCVACLTEADCPVGTCSPNHACVPLPDGCGTAEQLDLAKGPVHVTGSLLKAADDTRLSCAASTQGNDLVYQLSVPSQGRLVATVISDGSFRPALELRSTCSGAQTPLSCGRAGANAAGTATLQVDGLATGTYFLWLDSDDGAAGDFTLDVAMENPEPSDSCSMPNGVELKNSPVVITGTTVGLKDDSAGTCGGQGAPDAVLMLHTASARSIRVELSTATAGFAPVFYLRQQCDSGDAQDQVACVSGSSQAFTVPNFGPGSLYLFIDGRGENQFVSAGDFTVTVTPTEPAPPPQNDSCGFAQTLPVPATGSGSISVQSDTTSANDDSDGCGGTGSPDVVYRFHLDEPRLVQTTVTALSGANYLPMVYLRPATACASESPSDQIACTYGFDFGQSVTAVVPSLPAGDWFLWVDGLYSAGPFNLQVDTADPPPTPTNDTCSMPGMLNISSGYSSVTGTTLGATEDVYDARCAAGAASPDVVYGVSLAQPSFIGLDLKAASGSALEPVVELRGGQSGFSCTDSLNGGSLLGCNWGDGAVSNRTVFTAPAVGPGDYYVWVEGDYGTQGDFSLRVVTEATPAAAPNDTCQSLSAPLTLGMSTSGDTRNAQPDALDPLLDGDPADFGRDVVYPVVVGSNSTLTVTVTPDATEGTLLRPVLALRTTCNDANTTVDAVSANDYGTAFSHTFTNLALGTYYLWVGGVRRSSGAFTLQLQ